MEKLKESAIKKSRLFAQWFEIDIAIKLFGVTIFEYHFPPQERRTPEEKDLAQLG